MNTDTPGYWLMRKYLAIQVRYHRLACERMSIWTLPADRRPAVAGCKDELIESSMVLDDWARAKALLVAWEMEVDTLADVLRPGLESASRKDL